MNLKASRNPFQIPQAEKYLSAILPRLEEKRVRSFTTLAFSLFTLSFFGIFAIAPTLSTITDLQKQISDSQFVDQQLQQKIVNLTNLQASYKKIQTDLPVVFAAVPENPDVTELVGQIQTIAKNSQVSLSNVQTLPVDISTKTNTKYNSFTFAVDVSGNYDNAQAFLHNLSSFNRLITIDAISVSKPLSQSDGYSLSIRGEAYFQASK